MKKNVLNVIAIMPTGNKNKKLRVIYKSKKFSSKFTIKVKTKLKHMHNMSIMENVTIKAAVHINGGQTKCRVEKRVIQTFLLKQANEMGHEMMWLEDLKVLLSGYSSER